MHLTPASGRLTLSAILTLSALLALSACGGAEDAGTPAPEVIENFSLQAPYIQRLSAATSVKFIVSGDCGGTATLSSGTPAPAVFETLAVYGYTQTFVSALTDCTLSSVVSTVNRYADAKFNPLGSLTPSLEYAVYNTAPVALPDTVKAGDTAIWATHKVYADSSKKTVTGERVFSWVIEAEANDTVVANFIVRDYDTKKVLLLTEQTRYRLGAEASIELLSIDQQTATNHLLYTAL
ncbi:hypothetical protein [Ideonella sp.]|uniref:hypothetical protein n=1 Tax=Ideonella sp. TaxID=1929293 RepID=UPI003BB73C3A